MTEPRCPQCGKCNWDLEAQRTTTDNAQYVDGKLEVNETDQTTHDMSLRCGACGHELDADTWLWDQAHTLFVG